MGTYKAVGRNGKDTCMAHRILGRGILVSCQTEVYRRQKKRFFRICKVNDGYILEELGKALAKRETESQKNGGVRQAHPPKIFIWITA